MANGVTAPLRMENVEILKPTWEEFQNVTAYLNSREVLEAGTKCGIVKVSTPIEWKPTEFSITVKQKRMMQYIYELPVIRQQFKRVPKQPGMFLYTKLDAEQISYSNWHGRGKSAGEVIEGEWRKVQRERIKGNLTISTGDNVIDEVHNKFWATLDGKVVLYAADLTVSLMRDDVESWNLGSQDFPCLITAERPRLLIPGITTSYTYFGAPSTAFPWHTEDVDLISANYVHEAESDALKVWYSIPTTYGSKFEKLVAGWFPVENLNCASILRHKHIVIHPQVLLDNGIPVFTTTQKPGEMIITMPFAYHSGYNTGFNIAEARNVLTSYGLSHALAANHCSCENELKMDPLPLSKIEDIVRKRDPKLHAEYDSYKKRGLKFPRAGEEVASVEAEVSAKRKVEDKSVETPKKKPRISGRRVSFNLSPEQEHKELQKEAAEGLSGEVAPAIPAHAPETPPRRSARISSFPNQRA